MTVICDHGLRTSWETHIEAPVLWGQVKKSKRVGG